MRTLSNIKNNSVCKVPHVPHTEKSVFIILWNISSSKEQNIGTKTTLESVIIGTASKPHGYNSDYAQSKPVRKKIWYEALVSVPNIKRCLRIDVDTRSKLPGSHSHTKATKSCHLSVGLTFKKKALKTCFLSLYQSAKGTCYHFTPTSCLFHVA